jgi:hypothetical protein
VLAPSAAVRRVAAPYKAPAKKKAFSFKYFFDMFSTPQIKVCGVLVSEIIFCLAVYVSNTESM